MTNTTIIIGKDIKADPSTVESKTLDQIKQLMKDVPDWKEKIAQSYANRQKKKGMGGSSSF